MLCPVSSPISNHVLTTDTTATKPINAKNEVGFILFSIILVGLVDWRIAYLQEWVSEVSVFCFYAAFSHSGTGG